VTTNRSPTAGYGGGTGLQSAEGPMLVVETSVKPAALLGQDSTIRLSCTAVLRGTAAMAQA